MSEKSRKSTMTSYVTKTFSKPKEFRPSKKTVGDDEVFLRKEKAKREARMCIYNERDYCRLALYNNVDHMLSRFKEKVRLHFYTTYDSENKVVIFQEYMKQSMVNNYRTTNSLYFLKGESILILTPCFSLSCVS